MIEAETVRFFARFRAVEFPGRTVLEGEVMDAHRAPSPELAEMLDAWPGHWYWSDPGERRWLVLVRENAPVRERWWLHVTLFAIAFVTASLAGVALRGDVDIGWRHWGWSSIASGFPFSFPLVAILLSHELGHYITARRYGVDASPPYFIPCPPQLSLLGTLGAFIRLRTPFVDRRTLFDIGAGGPLAGLVVAIPTLAIGLTMSRPSIGAPSYLFSHQFVRIGGDVLFLGDSLLLRALRLAFAEPGVLRLHPVAVAGWAGLLVTMLNMMPMAQLDGSHVTFALFGRGQRLIAIGFWIVLVLAAVVARDFGWGLWAVLALLIGRGSLAHPPILWPEHRLDVRRRLVAWLTLLLGVACVMPIPIS